MSSGPSTPPPTGEPAGPTPAPPGPPAASLPYSKQRPPVAAGIVIWIVLLVLALVFRDDLVADGRGWWVWTCVAGVVLGGLGYAYVHAQHDD